VYPTLIHLTLVMTCGHCNNCLCPLWIRFTWYKVSQPLQNRRSIYSTMYLSL